MTAAGLAASPSIAPRPLDALGESEVDEPLVSYSYSYPHKSSYRRLDPPVRLADAWHTEDRGRLALYVHVPFCEMRCGFCNLFTQSQPEDDRVAAYLATLRRQMRVVRSDVPDARFAAFAVGGGTPTHLPASALESLFDALETVFDFRIGGVPSSVEASPGTATRERLRVLALRGVERVSLGVQSFLASEQRALGRPQRAGEIEAALDSVRASGVPALNVDLIYGHPAQGLASWLESVRRALAYRPEELYLYPLYVRPQTGLARAAGTATGSHVQLYREARDLLRGEGYEQLSLRCFRRADYVGRGSPYSCQRDGTIGLGCGARSYAGPLHYATRFAVSREGVRAILDDWIAQSDADLALATHGIRLSAEEQRRRMAILGLLQTPGLDLAAYSAQFGSSAVDDLPPLRGFAERGWLAEESGRLRLTESGVEHSDTIGPTLYSDAVRDRLREFVRR